MKHPRYGARPVYYSDVIVHADSSFRHFEDLRGGTWAYNEPGPHSGYNLVRYHLAMRGWGQDPLFRADSRIWFASKLAQDGFGTRD